MRLLLLAQGANVFGVPSTSVHRLLRPGRQQVLSASLDDQVGEAPTRLHSLARILKMGNEETDAGPWREAFVLRSGGGRAAAFLVDGLLREDEAVVKSLGPRLKSAPAYLGGTLLPDGRVALVLNPDYLINAAIGSGDETIKNPPAGPSRSFARKRQILFVEDSHTLRALGQRFLEQAGFDVRVAADGRQGLEMWKESGADAVVTDLEMPVMDGLALTRAIREAGGADVRIILLSGHDTAETRAAATRAGVNAYLPKNNALRELLLKELGV
jgi:two-component system chemotaxis sensor kinase CheA